MEQDLLLRSMQADVKVIKQALLGDIIKNEPGLIERLRQLEQAERSRKRTFWIAITAALTALINSFWR